MTQYAGKRPGKGADELCSISLMRQRGYAPMKYHVVIEEIVSDDFEIEADSEKDAVLKAIRKYNDAELMLEPGYIQESKIAVVTDSGELSDWVTI